jgi:hypothetical protein
MERTQSLYAHGGKHEEGKDRMWYRGELTVFLRNIGRNEILSQKLLCKNRKMNTSPTETGRKKEVS